MPAKLFISLLCTCILWTVFLVPLCQASLRDPASAKALARPRSLLQLLTGSSAAGNAASSLGSPPAAAADSSSASSATSDRASGILDIASALVGKGDGNASLYIKLIKLLLNLVMDVMMDRIAKREGSDRISLLPHLLQRPLFLSPPVHVEQARLFVP